MLSLKTAGIALLVALLLSGAASFGAYWQGRSDGYDKKVAEDSASHDALMKAYRDEANKILAGLARDIKREVDDRLKVLATTVSQLQHDHEVSNANAQALAAALRGRFVLSPDERMRFECIRRPRDARCAAAAVRPSIP